MTLEQKRVLLPNAIDGLVPVEIYLFSDGSLLVVPVRGFSPTFEHQHDGVSSMFDESGFSLWERGSDVYDYKYHEVYRYKQLPLLRGWLMQQDLSNE